MYDYVIKTISLNKKYDTNYAVKDVSLHVAKGEIYGLLGRNGAGKTTIMKMLLGLTQKTSGAIYLFGQEFSGYNHSISTRIGSTIESPAFYPNLTATENLNVFLRLRGKIVPEKVQNALSIVGLPYKDKKPFEKYSLGMKQRLAIANAIMNDPELLILDEPTNGLDPIGIAEMRTLISDLSKTHGKTILISSHQLSEMEQLVDKIGIIHNGTLLEECDYVRLKQKEASIIRLSVDKMNLTLSVLEHELGIQEYSVLNDYIEIQDLRYSTLQINKLLMSLGIGVSEIFTVQNSLEEHFKTITGGMGIA